MRIRGLLISLSMVLVASFSMAAAADDMPTDQEIEKLMKSYFDAWNAKDIDAMMTLFAEDAVWYDPAGEATPDRGAAEFRAHLERAPKATWKLMGPIVVANGSGAMLQFVEERNVYILDIMYFNSDRKVTKRVTYVKRVAAS